MIQFSRLRLNGFKSFVERTELEIGPGLNGIVGPNGCGKSNLVEALRWVMGENSAKRMRGGGMEDVIFNGTSKRTKRNIAEVSLLLNNESRSAPVAYNGLDEIEVVRKIERDHGSNYKINGKNVRARDVQMLFADTVTGANSPALVSQGRITQIINAKPHDRRMILEESAGIAGLYARRHEAELRLKAADANLQRIEDIVGSMEGRLNALKRQARQATRYRNISSQIRQMEILIAYAEWMVLNERMDATRTKFSEAETLVAEHLTTVSQLTKTQTTQSEDLPALRQKEAEIAAAYQTQKLAFQRLEDEATRVEQVIEETRLQLKQTETDFSHENLSLNENSTGLERLEEEHGRIIAEEKAEDGMLEEKDQARTALEKKVLELEERYTALMQSTAEAKARQDSLRQRIAGNENRLSIVQSRKEEAENQLARLKSENPQQGEGFEDVIRTLEAGIDGLVLDIEKTQNKIEKSRKAAEQARDTLSSLENKKSEFNTEITMLENFLQSDQENFVPVMGKVSPAEGFEKALSRALGDSLMASLDEKASSAWLEAKIQRPSLPDLPSGAESLLPHVKAPKALHASLSQIGVVNSEELGNTLWQDLEPGQSLVSKGGTYWRWDGYTIRASATDRHAQTLEQQNKLKALIKKRPQIEDMVTDARSAFEKELLAQEMASTSLKALQEKRREHEAELSAKRKDYLAEREAKARYESEISRLTDLIKISEDDVAELRKTLDQDRIALKAYEASADEDKVAQVEALRVDLNEARQSHSDATRAYDQFLQKQNTRKARLHAIADERVSMQNRTIRSRERIKQLEERMSMLTEKLEEFLDQPKDFESDKAALLTKLSKFETERAAAAERLQSVENAVLETTRALKEAENILSNAREARAHAQATMSAIIEQKQAMDAAIAEKFEMKPQDLAQHSAIDPEKDTATLETHKQNKERLIREREAIGPVNLRAEEEALALEKEVGGLLTERNDLVQAVEELRGAIQTINKEARERLIAAFEHVNAHFQRLFLRLFGGGSAHLALIDSDDPLGAGLEIFAQPPGKALQSLSLLSGGEQTMASIALIFSMFLTNPSPICVLDEIDAPLDDANVDRVCDLLEEIAERGETRFLVITHHRLTMARMHRLYGVTMAERGVSQLVSVDLQQSFNFLDEAA